MKKYIYLTVIFAILLSIVNISADAAKETIPEVSITLAKSCQQRKLISCSGVIKEKDTTEIIVNYPVFYQEVFVREGDQVKAGDVIAKVDREETIALLKKLDKENLNEILTNFGITDEIISIFNDESKILSDYSGIIDEIEAGFTDIISPCSGTVVSSNITGKALMTVNSEIIISDRNNMTMETYIAESNINQIEIGKPAYITVEAFPEKNFIGNVSSISPNAGAKGVKVILDINAASGLLKYGYTAQAEIVAHTYDDIVTVPYECISYDGENPYVFIEENSRAHKKELTVLTESLNGCGVIGINSGAYVINEVQDIVDGQSIKIKKVTE